MHETVFYRIFDIAVQVSNIFINWFKNVTQTVSVTSVRAKKNVKNVFESYMILTL